MPLTEIFTADIWAAQPAALEAFLQMLLHPVTPGAERAQPIQAALPSSAGGDDRPAGYVLQDGVAVIEIRGMILRRSGGVSFGPFSIRWTGQDGIRAAVEKAVADPQARAVLLSFDSPGGIAQGAMELASQIAALREKKPLYAYADGLCASAAYLWAASSGRVYAPASASVGSIGVLSSHVDRSAMNATNGIRVTYITGGTWKAAGNPDNPLSASDQAYLQERVNQLHVMFRNSVAAYMPVDAANPQLWGDGQVFLAEKALELGLICGIVTDRDELIARINKEIHMDKAELSQKHPELLAQIQAEARAEAEKTLAEAHKSQLECVALNTAALVSAVAGKDAAEKVAKLAASGITVAQLEVIALLAAQPAPATEAKNNPVGAEAEGRAEILAALRGATTGPLDAQPAPKGGDPIKAMVDRISAVGA